MLQFVVDDEHVICLCPPPPPSHTRSCLRPRNIGQGTVAVTYSPWAFKEGEQLFENYGQPNHQYFMYHGFTMANNTHDCVNVRIGIPAGTTEEEAKVCVCLLCVMGPWLYRSSRAV